MSVFVIGHARITDPEAFAEYADAGLRATEAAGGKLIAAASGSQTVMEGEQFKDGGIVIIQFPSLDAYRAFYNGEAYRAARKIRRNACTIDIGVVDGVD